MCGPSENEPKNGKGEVKVDQAEAVAVMLEKYEIVRDMFHGFDCLAVVPGPASKKMTGIAEAMEHILGLEDGKKRFIRAVTLLSKAFALAVPHEETKRIRDEVKFFQAIRAVLAKSSSRDDGKTQEELDAAIRQIVSKAVVSDEVVDIFSAAGLSRPDISILSDEFLEEVRELPHRNLAVELLQRLLNDEIQFRSRRNVVQARSFAERLEESIRRYQNRSIEAAQIIAELIELAKEMREARERGKILGLTDDEEAFYDALEVNDSAVKVLGDETLRQSHVNSSWPSVEVSRSIGPCVRMPVRISE